MADNTVINTGVGGDTIATDDIGGVKYQIVKLATGALDTATLALSGSGTATGAIRVELPTNGTGVVGLNAGSNVIGHVITDTGSTTAVTGTVTISGAVTEADGANTTLGAKADAKSTATDTTAITAMSVLKQISASVQAPPSQAVTNAGTFAVQATLTAETTKVIGAVNNLPATVDTNSGNKSASTLRVVLATDQPALTNKLLVTPDSVALPANQSVNVSQINGVTPLMGTGIMGTGSPRVTIASDNDPLIVKQATAGNLNATVVGTGTFVTQSTLAAETTKVIGVTRTSDGAGNLLTSNSTTYTAKFGLDANILGTLGTAFSTAGKVDVKGADGDVFVRQTTAANLNMTASQGGTWTVQPGNTANTTAWKVDGSAVTQPVSLASTTITGTVVVDDLAAAATGAAVPANAQYQGNIAKTSLPAAGSDGNLTGNMSDKFGRSVVLNNAMRDIMGTQTTTITSSTSETTIVTAIASTFNDLVSLFISNTSATATRVDIRDVTAGSVIFQLYIPAGDMRGLSLTTPWPQTTVNTAWTATCGTSVADIRVSALYIKNK